MSGEYSVNRVVEKWVDMVPEAQKCMETKEMCLVSRPQKCDAVTMSELFQCRDKWVRGFSKSNDIDDTHKWYNYGFVYNGIFEDYAAKEFPNTYAALKEMHKHYPIIMAGYSWLLPHSHIPCHRDGSSEGFYSIHIGLIVPENCHLLVDEDKFPHSKGCVIVFDDNRPHEAINDSDEDRIILYIKSQS